ncbi:voltage-gated purine nucleotide uniporter SLC17A9 isoform X2 [Neocloeon triangulifer]|uniref:voltage-gated purine nucleotide uniporter SLC17A9 isoform X2 n=1 Tax=Neocloeon triangulifer TaxID=2078957 RepID=UPI00286F712C|nr:voltage-gated purine nucleotide uniporter SLC17A9 isoform X2 [Neocloeon triangulifer]
MGEKSSEHLLRVDSALADQDVLWSRSERRRWLLTMSLGTCALYASRLSVPLVMPAMANEQQWTKTETGVVLSCFFWGYTLTQVIAGYMSDRFGGERVIILAGLMWSLATLAIPPVVRCYSHPVSWSLILLRVMHGAAQGFHFPSLSSLSSRRLSVLERGPFFSIATCGSAFGAILAATAGSVLLTFFGWPEVFRLIGVCGLAWVLQLRSTIKCTQRQRTFILLPPKPSPKDEERSVGELPIDEWHVILASSPFWAAAIAHACQNNAFYIMFSWSPMYFHENFPNGKDWIFNIVPWVFLIPATFLGRELSDRLLMRGFSVTNTRKIVEGTCLGVQAFGLLIMPFMKNFWMAVFCSTCVIASSGLHNNAVMVNPQDLAPNLAGSVFGLMNTVGAIPGFVGVYFAGYILEVTDSWAQVFITTALINLAGCALYLLYGSGERVV